MRGLHRIRSVVWKRAFVTALLAVTSVLIPCTAARGEPLSAVYVYDGSNPIYDDGDAASIDQIFYAFAVFKNGRLSVSHWKHFDAFQAFLQKHPQIVPILSIGGWGADGFSQAASTADGRAAFVEDALGLMREHGFLGVDIDWEYPGSSDAGIKSSAADRENYTLLLRVLRAGLDALAEADGVPRRLCVALSGTPWLIPYVQCGEIGAVVDQVNLMTYDMQFDGMASHHSALFQSNPSAFSAAAGVAAYIAAGIPADKIMLGAAFYGHSWRTKEAEPLYKKATKKGTVPYTQIAKLLQKNPDAAFFDEAAQAPYYFDGKTFISYDDTRSIARKRLFVQEQGLKGLFAWQYGADGTSGLVHAMKME